MKGLSPKEANKSETWESQTLDYTKENQGVPTMVSIAFVVFFIKCKPIF